MLIYAFFYFSSSPETSKKTVLLFYALALDNSKNIHVICDKHDVNSLFTDFVQFLNVHLHLADGFDDAVDEASKIIISELVNK